MSNIDSGNVQVSRMIIENLDEDGKSISDLESLHRDICDLLKAHDTAIRDELRQAAVPMLLVASEADKKLYSDKPTLAVPLERLDRIYSVEGEDV